MRVPPAIRHEQKLDLAHAHTWRVWECSVDLDEPRWVYVGTVKAYEPWDALGRLKVGRGEYLVMHADAERLHAFAVGHDFEREDVVIIKRRGWWGVVFNNQRGGML